MMRSSFWRQKDAAAVIEFALVVPILMLIVFAIIDFSRAYAQLNTINASLREGARFGAARADPTVALDSIKEEVRRFSSVFGKTMDTSQVYTNFNTQNIVVGVNGYPIPLITALKFIAMDTIRVTREVSFRWERAGTPPP